MKSPSTLEAGHGLTPDTGQLGQGPDGSDGSEPGTLSLQRCSEAPVTLEEPGVRGEARDSCHEELRARRPHSLEAPRDAAPSQGKGAAGGGI